MTYNQQQLKPFSWKVHVNVADEIRLGRGESNISHKDLSVPLCISSEKTSHFYENVFVSEDIQVLCTSRKIYTTPSIPTFLKVTFMKQSFMCDKLIKKLFLKGIAAVCTTMSAG